ncbi:MAG: NADH-quinone oxidoreductase subunit C [Chloroflexi bacterium]|nr:NADH-quinone oxidoreductase subunit C [Chloroflexota bacterium]
MSTSTPEQVTTPTSELNPNLQTAADLVTNHAAETTTPEPNRLDAVIDAAALVDVVQALVDARWGYLSTITGVDLGVEADQLEMLYHFCEGADILTLRVRVPRCGGVVPSVCGAIPSASMYERELIEMFGITVTDTPNAERLFLPEDWPDGVYPLLKDFSMDQLS